MNPTLKTPEKVLALVSLFIVLSSGAVAVAVENKVQEVVATEQVATERVRPVVESEPVKKTKPLSYFENKTSLTDIELVWLLEAVG